jgi:20S proteasome alpha/beta subunit
MTIIVAIRVPGQGAVLACDSRVSIGDEIASDSYVKCRAGAEVLYAACGTERGMLEQFEAHTWPEVYDQALSLELQDWSLLAADKSGVYFLHHGGFRLRHPFKYATGSGAPFALGYMDACRPAKSVADAVHIAKGAVKCAIARDSGCGGKIRVITL